MLDPNKLTQENNNRLRYTSRTLAASGSAGDEDEFQVLARYLTIVDATYPTDADLEISMDADPFTPIFKSIQFDLRLNPIQKFVIRNKNAAVNTVKLMWSAMPIIDNRVNLTGNIDANMKPSTGAISSPAAVNIAATSQGSIAANTLRTRWLDICNLSANGTVITVGDSNVSATRGVEVPSGQTYRVDSTGIVYIFNPSAGAINITYNEL